MIKDTISSQRIMNFLVARIENIASRRETTSGCSTERNWVNFFEIETLDLRNDREARRGLTYFRTLPSSIDICERCSVHFREHPVSLSNVIKLELLSPMKVSRSVG